MDRDRSPDGLDAADVPVTADVDGDVARGYERLRDAVALALDRGGRRRGGSRCVRRRTGCRPLGRGPSPRTLVHTRSAVKPVAGTCLLAVCGGPDACRLRARCGRSCQEQPMAGCGSSVLGHAAGLTSSATGDGSVTIDWDRAVRVSRRPTRLAPGEHVGEHVLTFGHLVGARAPSRRSHRSRFLEEELSQLGLDVPSASTPTSPSGPPTRSV
jgi:hypothetical protein